MTTITLERTVELLDGSEHDVEIEIGIWGRRRRATHEDPAEEPEVEILSVRRLHDGYDHGRELKLKSQRASREIPLDDIEPGSLGDWHNDALRELSERDWD